MKAHTQLNTNTAQHITSTDTYHNDAIKSVQDDVRNRLQKMKVLFAEIQEIKKNTEIIRLESLL